MSEQWLINSVPLESAAVILETDEGLNETPAWRDRDVEIPGMHGVLDPGLGPSGFTRTLGSGRFAAGGMVLGVDPDTGDIPPGVDALQAYYDRVDAFVRMWAPKTLTIEHVRPNGTIRRAIGRRVGVIAPARQRASPWFGRWKAEVSIPGAFWAATQDVTITATVASGGTIPLGALAAGNAPIVDALITFGPGSNPTLVQGGTYLAYDGIIAAGRELAVVTDPTEPEVGPGLGSTWAPLDSAIRHGPGAAWFEIDPTAGNLTLNHTGGGQMKVTITARPRYLTS